MAGIWAAANMAYLIEANGFEQTSSGALVPVSKLCWVLGLTYKDAYKDWWYIQRTCEAFNNIEPGSVHVRDEGNDQCSFRTRLGQLVQTVSGEDPTNVGREDVDLLVGAEASRWSSELFDRAHGRVERRAAYSSAMYLSGSFESSVGPFFDWYKLGQGPNLQGARSYSLPSWTNLSLYPGGIDDPAIARLRDKNSDSRFMERYGGQPAAPKNIVIPEFNSILHVDSRLDWQDGWDTYIGIDPGSVCYAWVMWQHNPEAGEVCALDEGYINRGSHQSSIEAAKMSPGWKHCLRTRRAVIDIAGFQEHGNPDTVADIWRRETGFWVTGKRYPVETTVERLRSLLRVNPSTGRARLRIHPRCKGLRAELGDGSNPIPGRSMWLRYSEHGKPRDDSCDAVKALGYSVSAIFGTDMPGASGWANDLGDTSYIGKPLSRPREHINLGEGWKVV